MKIWAAIGRFAWRDRWAILAAVCAGALVCGVWGLAGYARREHAAIAGSVIRLHVRANSDSDADQALKLAARDAVLAEMDGLVSDEADIDDTRAAINGHLREIENAAAAAIARGGGAYAVTAYLTRDAFPTKRYGDVTLPAGVYEALRVDIGEHAGRNWWCVLFPPLCVSGAVLETPTESRDKLKAVLTAEQYGLVTAAARDPRVKIKFKIVELLGGGE